MHYGINFSVKNNWVKFLSQENDEKYFLWSEIKSRLFISSETFYDKTTPEDNHFVQIWVAQNIVSQKSNKITANLLAICFINYCTGETENSKIELNYGRR